VDAGSQARYREPIVALIIYGIRRTKGTFPNLGPIPQPMVTALAGLAENPNSVSVHNCFMQLFAVWEEEALEAETSFFQLFFPIYASRGGKLLDLGGINQLFVKVKYGIRMVVYHEIWKTTNQEAYKLVKIR